MLLNIPAFTETLLFNTCLRSCVMCHLLFTKLNTGEVKLALSVQKGLWQTQARKNNSKKEVSSSVSGYLTMDQEKGIIYHAMSKMKLSAGLSFLVAWTLCMQTLLRMFNVIFATLPMLKIDYTHGQVVRGIDIDEDGEIQENKLRIVKLVVPRGTTKSDNGNVRETKTYEQGMRRHRDCFRNADLMVATRFFYILNDDDAAGSENFSFLQEARNDDSELKSWRKWHVVGWDKMSACESAFIRAYDACGAHWKKIVHLRTLAFERISAYANISPQIISQMTHHSTDKVYFYTTMFPTEVLNAAAGFFKNPRQYFIAEEEAESLYPCVNEHGINEQELGHTCASIVFNNYDKWVKEYQSEAGDKGEDTQEFLFHVIPHYAWVLMVYGFHWIYDGPVECQIRELLLRIDMPGYQGGARKYWEHMRSAVTKIDKPLDFDVKQKSSNPSGVTNDDIMQTLRQLAITVETRFFEVEDKGQEESEILEESGQEDSENFEPRNDSDGINEDENSCGFEVDEDGNDVMMAEYTGNSLQNKHRIPVGNPAKKKQKVGTTGIPYNPNWPYLGEKERRLFVAGFLILI